MEAREQSLENTVNKPSAADSGQYPTLPVLLVDDQTSALEVNEVTLHSGGILNVLRCQDSREVLPLLSARDVGVLLLDLSMPYVTGQELLPRIAEQYPEVPVIVVTGRNELEVGIECMRAGAFDYLVKPVEETRMVSTVQRAIEIRELRGEAEALKRCVLSGGLKHAEAFKDIVTGSRSMHAVFQYLETVGPTPRPVLVTGESGVGKELIARAIHCLSNRKGKFVAVNVAGLDDSAFSDTLFGHKRGAFTGADERRAGLIMEASGGTLLLDEVGDLEPSSQVKLLRLLQESEYYPLGSDVPRPTDARFIATTNRDLKELRDSGRFRRDLYFRLQTHQVHIPPLRERPVDLPALLDHCLTNAASELDKKKPTPPHELVALLSTYHFPGNVRELEAMVFDAVSRHSSRILSMETFKSYIAMNRPEGEAGSDPSRPLECPFAHLAAIPTLAESTQMLIDEALKRASDNQSLAAQLLGISQSSLSKRLKRAGK
jgi:DNA-binding NtrC family response regulator